MGNLLANQFFSSYQPAGGMSIKIQWFFERKNGKIG